MSAVVKIAITVGATTTTVEIPNPVVTAKPNPYSQGKIYLLRNTINDIVYVGSTISPLDKGRNSRLQNHRSQSNRGKGSKLYQAMRSLGTSNFYMQLLENFPCNCRAELEDREFFHIKQLLDQGIELFNTNIERCGNIHHDPKTHRYKYEWKDSNFNRRCKYFSYVHSHTTQEQALKNAQEFQRATFPNKTFDHSPCSNCI